MDAEQFQKQNGTVVFAGRLSHDVKARMRRLLITLLSAYPAAVLPAGADAGCLEYAPAQVTLSGTLKRLTFPGRPNYESTSRGDEPETHFYLALHKPLCTVGDPESADSYPQQNVSLVQLVLDDSGYAKLKPRLGQKMALSGTLFAAHTAHHHAPVLLRRAAN